MSCMLKIYPKNPEFVPNQAQEEALMDILNEILADSGDIDRNLYETPVAELARYIVEIHEPDPPQTLSAEALLQVSNAMGCPCAQILTED